MSPTLFAVCIILLSLAFSAFFSGIEIAFVSADRLKFELDRQKNSIPNTLLSFLFARPQDVLSTILVGNNIALVIYGLQMAYLLESPFNSSHRMLPSSLFHRPFSPPYLFFWLENIYPKLFFALIPIFGFAIFHFFCCPATLFFGQ